MHHLISHCFGFEWVHYFVFVLLRFVGNILFEKTGIPCSALVVISFESVRWYLSFRKWCLKFRRLFVHWIPSWIYFALRERWWTIRWLLLLGILRRMKYNITWWNIWNLSKLGELFSTWYLTRCITRQNIVIDKIVLHDVDCTHHQFLNIVFVLRVFVTISSIYPEKEIYKSMITSFRDHTFV